LVYLFAEPSPILKMFSKLAVSQLCGEEIAMVLSRALPDTITPIELFTTSPF